MEAGELPNEKDGKGGGGLGRDSSYLLSVKKQIWYLFGCSLSKGSTAGAFAVSPVTGIEPKNVSASKSVASELVPLGGGGGSKTFQATPTKHALGTS